MASTELYYGLTLNKQGGTEPWGIIENTLFKNMINLLGINTDYPGVGTSNGRINDLLFIRNPQTGHYPQVSIGAPVPDTGVLLHCYDGSAGAVASDAAAKITIESAAANYLQFLVPNASASGILFGDTADNNIGSIIYDHSTNYLEFTAGTSVMGYFATTGFFVNDSALITNQLSMSITGAAGSIITIAAGASWGILTLGSQYVRLGAAADPWSGGVASILDLNTNQNNLLLRYEQSACGTTNPTLINGELMFHWDGGANYRLYYKTPGGTVKYVAFS